MPKTRDDGTIEEDSYQGGANPKGSEVFVGAGVNVNRVMVSLDPETPPYTTNSGVRPALRARRASRRLREQRSRRAGRGR